MAELTEAQKTILVTMLAHFKAPAEIVEHFRKEEGLEIPFVQVSRYDPASIYFEAGDKWRELHAKAREVFVASTSQHAVANQAWRLAELEDLYRGAKKQGNKVLAAQLLRQAAEEVGGALTNERKVTRSGEPDDPDERRRMAVDILRSAFERAKGEAPSTGTVQ